MHARAGPQPGLSARRYSEVKTVELQSVLHMKKNALSTTVSYVSEHSFQKKNREEKIGVIKVFLGGFINK